MTSANDSSTPTPTTSPEAGRTSIQAVPPAPESSTLQGASTTDSPPAKTKRKRLTVEGMTRFVSRMDIALVGIGPVGTDAIIRGTVPNGDAVGAIRNRR